MRSASWRRVIAPMAVGMTVVGLLAVSVASQNPKPAGSAAATIEIIDATSRSLATTLSPPGSAEPRYLPSDLVLDTSWEPQTATEPDISTNPAVNKLTGRTAFMLDSAISAGLTRLGRVGCVGGRASNPSSDHPSGKACDLMFDPNSGAGVEAGWRAANWLIANQAVLGVRYVIWQGLIWNAATKVRPWGEYVSTAYGCPNPANVTGCHYDHVHVSMF